MFKVRRVFSLIKQGQQLGHSMDMSLLQRVLISFLHLIQIKD